ncbi:MAG: hypothetical protein DRO43_01635 [Candidatus Hecatellales archaeon]|nr:MAG: hypothetical protein DRO43_01635 [Candidatus Hecatellales archaeon]
MESPIESLRLTIIIKTFKYGRLQSRSLLKSVETVKEGFKQFSNVQQTAKAKGKANYPSGFQPLLGKP